MAFKFNFALDTPEPTATTSPGVDPAGEQPQGSIPERAACEVSLNWSDPAPAVILADPVPFTLNTETNPTHNGNGNVGKSGLDDTRGVLYRRQLSDAKFQLAQQDTMTEDSNGQTQSNVMGESPPTGGRQFNYDQFVHYVEVTDLVQGEYEGGMKTWECAADLVYYLARTFPHWQAMPDLRVLELGCGSALPGVFCLTALPQARVDMQDYNEEVLRLVTIPNILINTAWRPSDTWLAEVEHSSSIGVEIPVGISNSTSDDSIDEVGVSDRKDQLARLQQRCRVFAGDWSHMAPLLRSSQQPGPHESQYDLILTSETIYSQRSQRKLYQLIRSVLKPTGIALIAAKSVYFGCDGSLHTFAQLVEAQGEMTLRNVATVGNQVRREILELRFK
ncbi:hypothetical protein IWQ62_005144 [Dispira parvispora]|uniref:protein-histidine N-methyltransferase n=1 Tax=Dispira parvispora TaxID=1520584 RepID=A0A9W8AQZ6_9FUNG|nr:hypothetical protein IWQ62_005144 [Dispira parvispora]